MKSAICKKPPKIATALTTRNCWIQVKQGLEGMCKNAHFNQHLDTNNLNPTYHQVLAPQKTWIHSEVTSNSTDEAYLSCGKLKS